VWHHGADAPLLDAAQLQATFVAQAASIRQHLQQQVTSHPEFLSANTSPLLDFINKANMLATNLDLEEQPAGEKAWSDTVPVSDVFGRLRAQLINPHPPSRQNASSIQEVVSALDALLLPAEEQAEGGTPLHTTAPTHEEAVNDDNRLQQHVDTCDDSVQQQQFGVDNLFTTIEPPVLSQLVPRHGRQRWVFNMAPVRRSARLAKRPVMPAMERAQRHLCRKLGIQAEDQDPIDGVLSDFVAMFQGPLPQHVIAALTALFDLDNEYADVVDNALLQHAGAAVGDLAPADEAA
jgi:hypothetical protein